MSGFGPLGLTAGGKGTEVVIYGCNEKYPDAVMGIKVVEKNRRTRNDEKNMSCTFYNMWPGFVVFRLGQGGMYRR
jgi:hypothetical protein